MIDNWRVRIIVLFERFDLSVHGFFDWQAKWSTLTAHVVDNEFRMIMFLIINQFIIQIELKYYNYDNSKVIVLSHKNTFMINYIFRTIELNNCLSDDGYL
jgi:hypothetical protein